MSPNTDGLHPSWDWAGDLLEDDGLTEYSTAKDVSDGTVGAPPHLLELKLLHAGFIGCDGRAFDADAVFQDRLGGLDRDLVVSLG